MRPPRRGRMRHAGKKRSVGVSGRLARMGYSVSLAAAGAHLGYHSQAARAATEADWLTAASGTWATASLWSTNPFYPNQGNPAGSAYDASISAAGTAYTVSLNTTIIRITPPAIRQDQRLARP
jgi:hypothetical protein